MLCSFKPYEGDEPYIFISYSHKDDTKILHILEELNKKNFRIWYDEGIEVGAEWRDSIAMHIWNCDAFIIFFSKDSIVSENCKDEIALAAERKKKILSVYLENVEPNRGIYMQICRFQKINFYQYKEKDINIFYEKLTNTKILQKCKENDLFKTPDWTLKDEKFKFKGTFQKLINKGMLQQFKQKGLSMIPDWISRDRKVKFKEIFEKLQNDTYLPLILISDTNYSISEDDIKSLGNAAITILKSKNIQYEKEYVIATILFSLDGNFDEKVKFYLDRTTVKFDINGDSELIRKEFFNFGYRFSDIWPNTYSSKLTSFEMSLYMVRDLIEKYDDEKMSFCKPNIFLINDRYLDINHKNIMNHLLNDKIFERCQRISIGIGENPNFDTLKSFASNDNFTFKLHSLYELADIFNNKIVGLLNVSSIVPVILILDTSGSMVGKLVNDLYTVVVRMIETFAADEKNTYKIAIITFNNYATLHTSYTNATELKTKKLSSFQATGMTCVGEALKMAKNLIEDDAKTKRSWDIPRIFLLTDGYPTDDYKPIMDDFINRGLSSKCQRFSIGIGKDIDEDMLKIFSSKSELYFGVSKSNFEFLRIADLFEKFAWE